MEKSTSKRKAREREARREAILDAASLVMSEKGFHGATLGEIAEKAELAKGTLYLYYKDKEDLFYSLIERGYEDFRNVLPGLVEKRDGLENFIEQIFILSLEYMIRHRYLFRVVFSAEHQLSLESRDKLITKLIEHLKYMVESLKAAFSEMPEIKGISDADRETGAKIVLASMRFLFVTRGLGKGGAVPEEDIKHFARFISRALSMEQAS